MPVPSLPIFVVEGHDVGVYQSLDRAEGALEPIDVSAQIYTGYDALGRRLNIETDGKSTFIQLAEGQPSGATELEQVLREHLEALGDSSGKDPACDLPCLIRAVKERPSKTEAGPLSRFLGRLQRGEPGEEVSNKSDRIYAGITFVLMLAIAVSWVIRGFLRVSLGWQLGLGIPLLLIILHNGAQMLGKRDGLWFLLNRRRRSHSSR